jgi:hypothetical protein
MGALIPFTSNYTDVSTYEGYQFEFRCQRCGNGYRSAFRHSVTGFGGRIAALGGGLLGGEMGAKVQEVGLLAQWDRSGTRGSTNDKRLVEASEDVAGHFVQCRGCAEWVCRDVCWDDRAGRCTRCLAAQGIRAAQPGIGAMPPAYGRQPGRGPTGGYGPPQPGYGPPRVSLRHPNRPSAPAAGCPSCAATAIGRFCAQCGSPLAPPVCGGCGAPSQGTPFCPQCGTPARR